MLNSEETNLRSIMDERLSTWAFALQGTLQKAVNQQWPTEIGNWPLLRSFTAEGYRWRDAYLFIVLRNSQSQIPTIGETKETPAKWGMPDEAPSISNIDTLLDRAQQGCALGSQDAVFLVSTVGNGRQVQEDIGLWTTADKALWSHTLTRVLTRHLVLNVQNHAAQQQRLTEIAREQQRLDRAVKLKKLSDQLEEFETTTSMTPQQRGKRFETWLGDLFAVYALETKLNIINSGEQIDFTFWKGDLFVVGEARWLATEVDPPQVRDYFEKLRERPSFAVGLLISISGFTEAALDVLRKRSGERLVLTLDHTQIQNILKGKPEFSDWLSKALRERLEHPSR